MPTRYRIVLTFLYALLLAGFAGLTQGQRVAHWLLAEFGAGALIGVIAAYAGLIAGSVRLINKIHRDWPSLNLPPQATVSVMDTSMIETTMTAGLFSTRSPAVEIPVPPAINPR